MSTGPITSDSGNIFTGAYNVAVAGETLATQFYSAPFQFRSYARALKNVSGATITVTAVQINDAAVTGAGAPGSSGIAYTLAPGARIDGAFIQVMAGSWTLGQIVALC